MSYYRNYQKESIVYSKETVQEVSKYPCLAIPERGLTQETCELFGVRSAVSPQDGETIIAHYFPYFDTKGKLTGYKKRDLTIPKKQKYHFGLVGYAGPDSMLFGGQVAQANDRARKVLFLCEGEYDTLSVYQDCVEALSGSKWESMTPFVVGIQSGTANARAGCINNEEFIKSFKKLVIGFDNDSSTKKGEIKGKEATEEVATSLLHPETFVVEYPDGLNDPNEVLLEKPLGTLQKMFSFAETRFRAEKIVSSSDVSLDSLTKPKKRGVKIDSLPYFMNKTGGLRKGELWTITGPSGVGKTELCSELMYKAWQGGWKIGLIMLEETKEETVQRFIAKILEVNYNEFKDNPTKQHTKEQIADAKAELDNSSSIFLLDHFGSMPIKALMSKIKNFVHVNGVEGILLDHLSMVMSGLDTNNERKDIDMVMTELAAFCAANPVWIGVVNHLNRQVVEGFKPPSRRKDEEPEPYWVNITKEMMRGSGSLEQLSWVCLGIEPQIMPNKERGDIRLNVMKNRPWGYLGLADQYKLCNTTGKVILTQEQGGY